MKKIINFLIAIFIFNLIIFPEYIKAQTDGNTQNEKIIIYMIDNLALSDITPTNTPFLWKIQNEWATGLLNTSAAKNRTFKNACATVSAGQSAVGSANSHLNYNAAENCEGENAGTVFYRNTGIKPGKENIVISSFVVIEKNNRKRNLGDVGKLGEEISKHGYTTYIIGNADRPGYYYRPGAIILMNKKGLVDKGAVDQSTTIRDPNMPVFIWTDYDAINNKIKNIKEKSVILIEYGDLNRLEAMSKLFSPANYSLERQKILKNIDSSIAEIEKYNKSTKHCSYIINIAPSLNGKNPENLLTPVFIKKPGYNGILTSYSTRRDGIITLINLHDSILSCIVPEKVDPVFAISVSYPLQTLTKINKKAVFNYVNQPFILTFYAIIALLSFSGAILLILLKKKKLRKLIYFFIILPISIPATLFVMPLLSINSLLSFIIISFILSLFIGIMSFTIAKILRISPLAVVTAINVIIITADMIGGFELIKNSIMSYQLISGIRYYGLGNEYMGILIGSAITWAALKQNQNNSLLSKCLIFSLFALVIFLLSSPHIGINVGGTITACISLSFTWFNLNNRQLKAKDILLIIALTIAIISSMLISDLRMPVNQQSHLGNSFRAVINEGYKEALNIIKQKLYLHLKIINYTKLGWILLFLILTVSALILKPSSLAIKLKNNNPVIFAGIQGLLTGAITALIFNDSGIIPAGYLMAYALTLTIHSLLSTK
ncbi:hypothetical protein [Thermosyntropha sp.]|uniref:hypothetical protein n=1 Tax=Thermosyntropha sp. TaxID=2740820 RepID=UPI0025E1E14E|nr:hypothetical protein [Thermosyntropha sp.]MBO8159089.1 hypothetical protein [Thermosyntropha sp.]